MFLRIFFLQSSLPSAQYCTPVTPSLSLSLQVSVLRAERERESGVEVGDADASAITRPTQLAVAAFVFLVQGVNAMQAGQWLPTGACGPVRLGAKTHKQQRPLLAAAPALLHRPLLSSSVFSGLHWSWARRSSALKLNLTLLHRIPCIPTNGMAHEHPA